MASSIFTKYTAFSNNRNRCDRDNFSRGYSHSQCEENSKAKCITPYRYKMDQPARPVQENLNFDLNKIDSKDNLICNNCFNKNLMKSKLDNIEADSCCKYAPMKFQDQVKSLSEQHIKGQISHRQTLSMKAFDSIKNFHIHAKEDLQKTNENKTAFIYSNRDYPIERAKERNKRNEQVIETNKYKLSPKERPEITEYFQKCVDNPQCEQNFLQQHGKDKTALGLYYNELLKQMQSKQLEEYSKKEKERKEDQYNLTESLNSFRKEHLIKSKKEKALKEEMLKENLKLVNNRKRKELELKESEKVLYDQMKSSIEQSERDMISQRNEKKLYEQNAMYESLKNFADIKTLQEIEKKSYDEKSQTNGFHFSCAHGNPMSTCALCLKPFPLKMLSRNIFGSGKR